MKKKRSKIFHILVWVIVPIVLINVLVYFGPEEIAHILGAITLNGLVPALAIYAFMNPGFLTEEKPGTSDDFKYRNISIGTWHKITRVFCVFAFVVSIYLLYLPLLKDLSGCISGDTVVVSKTGVVDSDRPGPWPWTSFLIQNVLLKGDRDVFYTLYFSKNWLAEGSTYQFRILKNSKYIISVN